MFSASMSARSAIDLLMPGAAALQRADDTGAGEAAMHLDAPFLQLRRDDAGSRNSSNAVSGWAWKVTPPSGHLLVEIGDSVDDRHLSSLVSCRVRQG